MIRRFMSTAEFGNEWVLAQKSSESESDVYELLLKMKEDIRVRGDEAVLAYTRRFDGVSSDSFRFKVSDAEFDAAFQAVDAAVVASLKRAYENIRTYHLEQVPEDWSVETDGKLMGARYSSVASVGLYVPGGRAKYPSSVLMNAVPAMIAGVETICIVTPPNSAGVVHPEVLVAADICGVRDVYKVGGAQAVFSLAGGTDQIPQVSKIVGPGNVYVTVAKQMVYGQVDIDKPAGPSEVMVVVEDGKYAGFAASEVLAQLEHDDLASAVVVSSDSEVLDLLQSEILAQKKLLKRQTILDESLGNCFLVLAESPDEIIGILNLVASEHLVLLVDEYQVFLEGVQHAGAIFCGPYTPVALGDYFAGPNHVLPTAGAARFASPLGVMDFMKYSSVLALSKGALEAASGDVIRLAGVEGLDGHGASVQVRLA